MPSKPGDWPQWRGPNRDGISLDKGLLKEWPTEGPKVAWQVDSVGVGYSSLAVKDGKIFTLGDVNGVEHILALDAIDGRTLWSVQPAPVVSLLETRIASDLKQLDRNNDGSVSEVEALGRFGWDWNKYDKPSGDAIEAVAERRSAAFFKELDKDADGKLLFSEAGNLLRDAFDRIDAPDTKADAAALAKQRAESFLKELDKDDDKNISRQECRGTALDRHFGRIDVRDPATNKETISSPSKRSKPRSPSTKRVATECSRSRNCESITSRTKSAATESSPPPNCERRSAAIATAWETARAVRRPSMAIGCTPRVATAISCVSKPRPARRFGTSICGRTLVAELPVGDIPNRR